MRKITVAQATVVFGTLVAAMLVAGFLLPGMKKPPEKAAAKAVKDPAAQMLEGVKLDGGEPGRSKWSLSARRAEADQTGEVGTLYDIELSLTTKDGLLKGKAAKAQKLSASGVYLLSGGVDVERGDWRVRTESLTYDQTAGKLRGDVPVELTTGRIDLTAGRFEADVNESRVVLRGGTHAVLKGALK